MQDMLIEVVRDLSGQTVERDPLMEAGVDSLAATELYRQLQEKMGGAVRLPHAAVRLPDSGRNGRVRCGRVGRCQGRCPGVADATQTVAFWPNGYNSKQGWDQVHCMLRAWRVRSVGTMELAVQRP